MNNVQHVTFPEYIVKHSKKKKLTFLPLKRISFASIKISMIQIKNLYKSYKMGS